MGLFTRKIRRSQSTENQGETKEAPNWLKMLQDNSWELEILISGGAIFSLFELSGFVNDFVMDVGIISNLTGLGIIYVLISFAIKSITLGFALHVLVRSFWVALIALTSMFPVNKTQYSVQLAKPFKTSSDTYVFDLIIKIDRLSSWLMFNSFTLLIAIIGFTILFICGTQIGIYLETVNFPDSGWVIGVILSIYLIDLLSFSFLRKIPYFSYLIYPIFFVFDLISLRFVYKATFEYVSRNILRWKIALFYLLFIVMSFIYTYISVQKTMNWTNIFDKRDYRFHLTDVKRDYSRFMYRDKIGDGQTKIASIQSDIITDHVISLFIHYTESDDYYINKIKDPYKRSFENIFEISVDDSVYNSLIFYTNWGESPQSLGITTYVDISNFNRGPHILNITNLFESEVPEHKTYLIPFWLDKEADQ